MKIKCEIDGKVCIRDIPDEELERMLSERKPDKEKIGTHQKALEDLKQTIALMEEQLKGLSKNAQDIETAINESQTKLDEPI